MAWRGVRHRGASLLRPPQRALGDRSPGCARTSRLQTVASSVHLCAGVSRATSAYCRHGTRGGAPRSRPRAGRAAPRRRRRAAVAGPRARGAGRVAGPPAPPVRRRAQPRPGAGRRRPAGGQRARAAGPAGVGARARRHRAAPGGGGLAVGLGRPARRHPAQLRRRAHGGAEDLAGIAIVLFIAGSCALAAFEAVRRLREPADVRYLGAVAAAALVGFAGNELVARYRIAVGREIGSAALVADGLHARSDGFASLAVLLGVAGVALGIPLADPVVGLGITGAILVVGWDAARQVYRRLMDAVDPSLVDQVEQVLLATSGVLG